MSVTTPLKTRSSLVAAVILVFAASRGVQRILTGLALGSMDAWTITAVTLAVAALVWFPLAAWKGWLRNDAYLWKHSILLAIVNIVIPGVAFTAAQMFLTASVTALLVATLPMFIAIFAAIFLKEHITRGIAAGLLAGTAGVLLLVLGRGGALDGSNWVIGILVTAVGVGSAAAVYVAWRNVLKRYTATVLLGPQLLISALIAAPLALLFGSRDSLSALTSPSTLAILVCLGIVNYVLPQVAMFWLLARTTAVRSALANYLAPLFATVLAVPILGQHITWVIVCGGALVLTGAGLINYSKSKPVR